MFQNIGTPEILIGILLLVIIFGGNKVGEIAKGLGEATREIKKAKKDVEITKKEIAKDPEPEVEVKVAPPKSKKLTKKIKPLQKIKK